MDDNDLPACLDRKKNPVAPPTANERAAFAAQTPVPVETKPEPDPTVDQIEKDQERKKKAKQSNRIGRLVAKKAVEDIPEKFRAWDTDRSQFYDTRNGKPKKESIMTAVAKKKPSVKVISRLKSTARRKPVTAKKVVAKKAAPVKAVTAARSGSKIEKMIAMLRRENGASLAELLRAFPKNGKTPLNTIAAQISVLRKTHKVEVVGGKGEQRRFRIV